MNRTEVRERPARPSPDVGAKRPFEAIVTVHGPTVLRVTRALVGRSDADDAWSETFLAALRAYPELPADANIEAWLVTIAHRKALDLLRANRRRAIPVAELPERAQAAPADNSDLDLGAAVQALPLRQRQAVSYHYLAALPYAEIALIVGSNESAVRRAAADGIANLRRCRLHIDDGASLSPDSSRRHP